MEQIIQSRQEKSDSNAHELLSSSFVSDFQDLLRFLDVELNSSLIRLKVICKKISGFRDSYRDQVNPIFILSPQYDINLFTQEYIHTNRIIEVILKKLSSESTNLKGEINKAHADLLLLLGDMYVLTSSMELDFLFSYSYLSQNQDNVKNWVDQVRSLAKISHSKHRQDLYLSLFNQYTNYRKTNFYKTDEYMWGYARLLLWYINVNDCPLALNYIQHFASIVTECLGRNPNINADRVYIRDALIALIYLLTFREVDAQFVAKNSSLYYQSKQLCRQLESAPPIRSQKANIQNMSLFFEQLLDGTATPEQCYQMIEID